MRSRTSGCDELREAKMAATLTKSEESRIPKELRVFLGHMGGRQKKR